MKHPLCLAGLALGASLLYATTLAAANTTADDSHHLVVVTATRTPVELADTLASVSVLPRERIEALQPLDFTDLLRLTPGLDISRNGGPGASTSLYTRGSANGHTLILVDGQRIGSATLGQTSFQFLNPDQIERIEVVRGSHSSLYGSDAIGGVIQIFTRDGSGVPGSYLTTSAGSHSLASVSAGSGGHLGALRYGVNLSYLETDGFDNTVSREGFNRDRDGYRNRSANASLGYRFANGADLALNLLDSDNRNHYDNLFNPAQRPYSDTRLRNLNLRGRLPVTDNWLSQLSLGRALDDSTNRDAVTGQSTGDFRTTRDQLYWQNDVTLGEQALLTLGYDYHQDSVRTSNTYVDERGRPVRSRDNRALFAQLQGSWAAIDLVLGGREDDNQEFGRHTTGHVSLGLHLGDHHRLVASWAEGFKAPSFNDLYWPASGGSAGNPHLDPEKSNNRELGLKGEYPLWRWSLAWFDNDVDNLISWAPGGDGVWRPYNVNEAELKGGELLVGATLGPWLVDAGYVYVDARDANSNNRLVNRSRHNLTLNIDRALRQVRLGLSVKSQDGRYANAANSIYLGGYTTVAARLAWQVSRQVEATLRIDNLLDRDYRLANNYNQDGRHWLLGVTWRL